MSEPIPEGVRKGTRAGTANVRSPPPSQVPGRVRRGQKCLLGMESSEKAEKLKMKRKENAVCPQDDLTSPGSVLRPFSKAGREAPWLSRVQDHRPAPILPQPQGIQPAAPSQGPPLCSTPSGTTGCRHADVLRALGSDTRRNTAETTGLDQWKAGRQPQSQWGQTRETEVGQRLRQPPAR